MRWQILCLELSNISCCSALFWLRSPAQLPVFGAFPWPIRPAADICISFSSPTSFISNLDRVQACLPQLHIYCELLYMSQKLPFSHTRESVLRVLELGLFCIAPVGFWEKMLIISQVEESAPKCCDCCGGGEEYQEGRLPLPPQPSQHSLALPNHLHPQKCKNIMQK